MLTLVNNFDCFLAELVINTKKTLKKSQGKKIPIALESGLSESSPLGVAPPKREEALWDLGVVPVPDRLTALTP